MGKDRRALWRQGVEEGGMEAVKFGEETLLC